MKKYFQTIWKEIAERLVSHLIYISAIAALPMIIKGMVDCWFNNGIRDVIKWTGTFILTACIGMLAQYISQKAAWKLDKKFFESIRHDLFSTLIKMEPSNFERNSVGEYSSIVNNDIAGVEEYIEYCMEIIEGVIGLLIYAGFLFSLDYRIAIIILLVGCIVILLPRLTGETLSEKKKNLLSETGVYLNSFMNLLAGFSFANVFTIDNFMRKHKEALERMEKKRYEYGKYKTFANVLNGSVMYIVNASAVGILALLLSIGAITAGAATATISYVQDFMFPLRTLVDSINSLKSVAGVKTSVIEVLEGERNIQPMDIVFSKEIALENISFPERGVNNFSYVFEKGKSYAIVGGNGAGKSSILKIITQRLNQKMGEVSIDGMRASYDICNGIMFYLEQNAQIFNGGASENVSVFGSYENAWLNKDAIWGMNIWNANDCEALSGGERQAILAMRAIQSKQQILVLDEPLSAVSSYMEIEITKALLNTGKTMIMVTHNAEKEYLDMFDEVIVL